jgi:hypothetical protein
MLDYFSAILGSLGGGTVVLTGGWLVRKGIDQWFARNLEVHKHRLKSEADLQLERFRDALKRDAFHHEKRFGLLHERLFEALVEIYGPLYELQLSVASYVQDLESSDAPTKDEQWKTVDDRWRAFKKLYIPKMALIPKDLHKQFDEVFGLVLRISGKYTQLRRYREQGHIPAALEREDLPEQVRTKLRPLVGAVYDNIQKLLGHEMLQSN